MESLVENRFHLTKALYYEGILRIFRDSYGKTAKKYSLVFLIVWAVMAALLLFIGGTVGQVLLYLVMVLLFCLWLNVLVPRNHAKKGWEALVRRCGDDPERITRFSEFCLEIEAGGSTTEIFYSDILEIKQTKHLYVLVCKDKLGVMVAKQGFTTGSAEEAMALITRAQNKEWII